MKGKKASEKAGETDSQRCGLGVDFQRSIQKGENKSTVVCVCIMHTHTHKHVCSWEILLFFSEITFSLCFGD